MNNATITGFFVMTFLFAVTLAIYAIFTDNMRGARAMLFLASWSIAFAILFNIFGVIWGQ